MAELPPPAEQQNGDVTLELGESPPSSEPKTSQGLLEELQEMAQEFKHTAAYKPE